MCLNKMISMNNLEPEQDTSVSDVWPPPPISYPLTGSVPPPRRQSPTSAIALVVTGIIIGFGLAFYGIPPFMKGYTRWAELVPLLYSFLAAFLGNSARKEQIPSIRGLLWLACGSVSAWTFVEFSVQTGMQ